MHTLTFLWQWQYIAVYYFSGFKRSSWTLRNIQGTRLDYCKVSWISLWWMSQRTHFIQILVIVVRCVWKGWETSNKVFSGTQVCCLCGTDGLSVFIASYLRNITLSSLISLAIFFYNWASILLESDITLGTLIFSFLFYKIDYRWPNSLEFI